jgi:hypothetical protein
MKRPAVLIVGAVAGALLVAGIGASAHTGLFVTRSLGVQSGVSDDEASGARVEPAETPGPTETPEAQATEQPEPADNDVDNDNENENDDNDTNAAPAASGDQESGDHEGDHQSGGGDGGHDD